MRRQLFCAFVSVVMLASCVRADGTPPLPILLPSTPANSPAPADIGLAVQPIGATERGGIYAGVGFYLFQPHLQSNPAFQVNTIAPGVPAIGSQRDFHYDTSMSPQVWVGYETNSRLGIRLHWWMFDQKATETATVGPNSFINAANPLGLGGGIFTAPLDSVTATSRLQLDTADLEITQRWEPCHNWSVLFGGGVRYAYIAQDYAFSAATPGLGTTAQVTSARTFNGVGPTLSLEGHHGIGQSGFGLYATGRGSVLFGTSKQHVDLSNIGPAGVFGVAASNDSSRSDVVTNLDFEIGTEYQHRLGKASLLLQAGFVGQVWFGAGNSTNTDSTFTGNTNSNGTLGFIGLAVRAGVKF